MFNLVGSCKLESEWSLCLMFECKSRSYVISLASLLVLNWPSVFLYDKLRYCHHIESISFFSFWYDFFFHFIFQGTICCKILLHEDGFFGRVGNKSCWSTLLRWTWNCQHMNHRITPVFVSSILPVMKAYYFEQSDQKWEGRVGAHWFNSTSWCWFTFRSKSLNKHMDILNWCLKSLIRFINAYRVEYTFSLISNSFRKFTTALFYGHIWCKIVL